MIDKSLIEIMAKKPTHIYNAWLKNRFKKIESDQNKRVQQIIDNLNKKMK